MRTGRLRRSWRAEVHQLFVRYVNLTNYAFIVLARVENIESVLRGRRNVIRLLRKKPLVRAWGRRIRKILREQGTI